ncbi:hypothetical protein GCM10010965_25560 [Caldalkalibacillus thermarum]|uniref:hypothetical protein n=1 Tax=Caldalkalibacillus thermarum TaxID=296745 RepID=UPI0019CDCB6D|nr:hypothetical protein [Caldalkalibacillus thermarum]GGK31615.1 hypothetical protein GCM10010965_25560 [Caldalkalibacillus thermarum]
MNSWIIDVLNILIQNMTLSGYLYFMLTLFALAFIGTVIWYGRANQAHKLIIAQLRSLESNEDNELVYAEKQSVVDRQTEMIFSHMRQMNEWIMDRKRLSKKWLLHRELINAWQNYYEQFQVLQKSGEQLVPDVYDFFLEENFVHKYGRRKLMEVIPGIFVSLGILGTFMGLIAGLDGLTGPNGQFISTDSDTILGGIGSLISGMTVAFYSSIMGIILSLIWQLCDKFLFYPFLVHSFHKLRQELDHAFPTQAEESFLQQMVRNQKQHLEDFQTFMSEQLIPQMVSGFDEALKSVLEPHLQQTNDMIKQTLEHSSHNQLEGINEMVDYFVNSLNDVAGDQMKQLGETLQKTVEWQEKVHKEMTQLVESMQQAAREQSLMVEKTTKLTEQIHQYTDKITKYQSSLESTVAQLNETTDRNRQLQDAISHLLEKMTAERNTFDQLFEKHMDRLNQNVQDIIAQSEQQSELLGHYEQLMTQINSHLKEVATTAEANQQLSATLSQQAEVTAEMSRGLESVLSGFKEQGEQYQTLQKQLVDLLSKVQEERDKVAQISHDVLSRLDKQIVAMDERTDNLRELWSSTHQLLSQTNEHLSSSMNQFAEHMYQGLERTFDQFDRELSKAVQYLQNGINAMEEVVSELPDGVEKFGLYIKALNEQVEKITKQG